MKNKSSAWSWLFIGLCFVWNLENVYAETGFTFSNEGMENLKMSKSWQIDFLNNVKSPSVPLPVPALSFDFDHNKFVGRFIFGSILVFSQAKLEALIKIPENSQHLKIGFSSQSFLDYYGFGYGYGLLLTFDKQIFAQKSTFRILFDKLEQFQKPYEAGHSNYLLGLGVSFAL